MRKKEEAACRMVSIRNYALLGKWDKVRDLIETSPQASSQKEKVSIFWIVCPDKHEHCPAPALTEEYAWLSFNPEIRLFTRSYPGGCMPDEIGIETVRTRIITHTSVQETIRTGIAIDLKDYVRIKIIMDHATDNNTKKLTMKYWHSVENDLKGKYVLGADTPVETWFAEIRHRNEWPITEDDCIGDMKNLAIAEPVTGIEAAPMSYYRALNRL